MQNKELTRNTTELRECPFCGAEARIAELDAYIGGQVYVMAACTKCMARTIPQPTKELAVAAWNRRVHEDKSNR